MRRVVAAALLLLASCSALGQAERDDAHIRLVLREALDDALREQVKHIFETWMKDETGQPDRARVGVQKAVRAYKHSIDALERAHY